MTLFTNRLADRIRKRRERERKTEGGGKEEGREERVASANDHNNL